MPRRAPCVAAVLAAALATTAATGCAYRGAKVTEGTDLAVGISVPGADGALRIDALNWLSGFRLAVAENSRLTVDYATSETNDYLGVVHTRTAKRVMATVEPLTAADRAADASKPTE